MRSIKLIEVKSELGAGTRGASLGIDAMKIASIDLESDYFARYEAVSVKTDNSPLFNGFISPSAKFINAILSVEKRVCEAVAGTLEEKSFPIILAGDHSTATGSIAGVKMHFADKRLGIIWIDAHADLHTPYTTPSGNVHGMPLAMALATDNIENQVNQPPPEVIHVWDEIKKIGVDGPKFDPADVVFIAVRDTEEPEEAFMKAHDIKNFKTEEVRKEGPEAIAEKALAHLADCDVIYISFDVDSLDSSISLGTGTPVPNGLTVEEAKTINETLVQDARVCAWEIVEVNPTLDSENKMAEVAFEILEATTNAAIKAKSELVND